MVPINRRRFIGIVAGASASQLSLARADLAVREAATWRGAILGAPSLLRIHHPDPLVAERLISLSVGEAQRLERIFSLYRPDSALAELNRRGALAAPPAELVRLLSDCRRYHELTHGVFDPSVQPLWKLHVEHFSRSGAGTAGPSSEALAAALAKVGFAHVQFSRDRVAFSKPGMSLTLNGIAQGFITDRVVDILRERGIDHSLVDMGEIRAIGPRPDGGPWRVGIPGDEAAVDLVDKAVATSSGCGFAFDPEGRFNHLFDPVTGRSPDPGRSVTVIMSTAAEADALSTAMSLMPDEAVRQLLEDLPHGHAYVRRADHRGNHRGKPSFPLE